MSLVDDFIANAEGVLCHVHRGQAPPLEGAGVSTAIYGLADTGSVVLSSSTEARAQSLLPDVHVTMLREDLILPGLDELFAALGDDLPSALAIVTGPSRSADIEQKLAVGVHGPREVHVVLLPAAR
jgi:L-lactate dehydrogenase complex protein LldG